jgi:hypothetical protein
VTNLSFMQKPITKQKGIALIILAVIISLIIITLAFNNLNAKQLEAFRKDKTAKALFEAKNALLGWSVLGGTNVDMPGQLPCPEDTAFIGTANEGLEMASCNSPLPVVGRLPWKTMGLGDLRDGNGDKLWYALSSGFRSAPINSTSIGQLNVDGIPNAAIAIIFSPGVILAGQNRPIPTAISPPLVSDYLDLTNNNGDINFSSTGPSGTFNDGLLLVTQSDLFSLAARRILREVRGDNTQGLVKFYAANSNNYAFADTNNDGYINAGQLVGTPSYQGISNTDPSNLFFNTTLKNILVNNGWMPLINYQISASRQTVTMNLYGQSLVVP